MSWIDLETGLERFVSSVLNPQMSYGDNVIDRINYAKTKDQNHLRKVLVDRINEMIIQGKKFKHNRVFNKCNIFLLQSKVITFTKLLPLETLS